jgi:hypothetical protein
MSQAAAAEQIILRFALIEAMNSAHRDPAIAEVDTVLRDLFRFAGYRLLAQAAVSASPGARTSQLLSAAGTEYALDIYVAPRGAARGAAAGARGGALTGVTGGATAGGRRAQGVTASGGGRASASPVSVSLEVTLTQNPGSAALQDRRTILHTTVSISAGHTLVLGSTQPSGTASTLILTVRPEIK